MYNIIPEAVSFEPREQGVKVDIFWNLALHLMVFIINKLL